MSTKIANKGHIIKSGSSATPTVTLPGVVDVSPTGGERDMIPASTHDTSAVEENIPSPLRKARGLSIKIDYDPADTAHEAVRAAHAAVTPWYFTHILPDAGAAQFAMVGIITKFTVGPGTIEGLLSAEIEFLATAAEAFTQ